jgi:hypothetical protein
MSSQNRIRDFKTCGYFPAHIIFLGLFLILVAVLVAGYSLIGAGVVLLVSLFILTTHYRLRIDFQRHTYHDYLWIFGLKSGERGKFESIQHLYLKASSVSKTMHSRGASSTIKTQVIDAYIRFIPENKIHLFTKDSRHDVIVRLREIARLLDVTIVDYTQDEPAEIKRA